MFGIPTDLIQLVTNKQKLAEKVKAEAPAVLEAILQLIAAQCGAQEGDTTAVVFYTAKDASGKPVTMARVHRVDPFGEMEPEELGTINLPEAIRGIPNEAITDKLPW